MVETGERHTASGGAEPRRTKITSALHWYFKPVAQQALAAMNERSRDEHLVYAEVLEVNCGDVYYFLRVRDTSSDNEKPDAKKANPDDVSLPVWLSRKFEEPLEQHTYEFLGHFEMKPHYETGVLEMHLVVRQAKRLGVSKRWTERRKAYAEIRARVGPPFPIVGRPRLVQLVTAARRDGERDFKDTLQRMARDIAVETTSVRLKDVAAIAAGIRAAAAVPGVDLVAIVRGGGEAVELDRFNDPVVVEAVAEAAQRVPVLVGVGHQRHKVEAARVATNEFITPTATAEFIAKLSSARAARGSTPPERATSSPSPASSQPWRGTPTREDGEVRIVVDNDPFAHVLRWLLIAFLCIAIGLALGYFFWGRGEHPPEASAVAPVTSAPSLVEEPTTPVATPPADAGPSRSKRRSRPTP
jgi:hypothetical protein